MSEFKIEKVGGKRVKKHPMPSAEKVAETLKDLWSICWGWEKQPDWTPSGEFSFRERDASDPVFRVRVFERGGESGVGGPERGGESGVGGLDLLGTYHRSDSRVTIYIDSCRKASRRYKVDFDGLVKVVLVHELAHLVTHRGFDRGDLLPGFMEHTAQWATYACLRSGDPEALRAFKELSPHQPIIYRTWESLQDLPKPLVQTDAVREVVRGFFQKVVETTLKPVDMEGMPYEPCYDE